MRAVEAKTRPEPFERRSEPAIRAAELSYRRLFESAKDGILILDAETGCITDVNPFLSTLLGFVKDEMVGRTVGELSPFHDIESNQRMLERLQKDGYARYEDLPLETRDGRKIAVEFVSNVYQAGDHNVIQCNIRDITARKHADLQIRGLNADLKQRLAEHQRLTAQFVEVQKMEVIGQLASGVAHDFNNILGIIMGYTDLIAADLGADSPLNVYVEEIHQASERAVGLTRQLLIFSRKHKVHPVVLDLNAVVGNMNKMLQRLIDENITMTIAPGTPTARISADAGYIGQVLMNLVINARDAMPNGGTLRIATGSVTLNEGSRPGAQPAEGALPREYVTLSVSDTGTGMTDDVKAHLFEAFYTTKLSGKGTGLGLATCRTIVEQSGGYIDVSSEVGQGTTFTAYFPRVEQPLEVPVPPVHAGPLPRGMETLLVVEDEPSVRNLARAVLEGQGYTVLAAANGQDALHVVREHTGPPIGLVVTDVIMPIMGGRVMAEWLKTTNPHLKFLFTSGYTDDAIAHHGVFAEGVEFLAKPYTPSALIRKVRELLDAAGLVH